jgi:sporulation protein YlmC with PRC-barrel domain
MRWMVLGTAFMLTLAPAGVTRAQPPVTVQPAPSEPSTSPQSTTPQGVQIDSRSLVGSTVRGEDGKDLGKVANVMIDANDGRVTALIITVGRTLGGTGITLGGKDITVPGMPSGSPATSRTSSSPFSSR